MATKTSPKIKTSFTNTKGEKVTVYTDGTKTRVPAPVINDKGEIDVSKVPEGVEVVNVGGSSLRDVSIAFSGKASDAQMKEIAQRDPNLTSRARQFSQTGTFVTTPPEPSVPLTDKEKLNREAENLASEIRTLEEKMANRETERTDAYDEAGVFEDLRALNELKAKQREIQDREIEIPIEGRQMLRGQRATKAEFGQLTRPAIENNLMEQLASSRQVSRLSETIETNVAIVDAKITAAKEKDEFLYEQKVGQLETITKAYADIITEEQKAAAEAKKFEYDLMLEASKSDLALRNELLKGFASKGVSGMQLDSMMGMSLDELLTMQYDAGSPKRWSEMSFEEAAMVLDKDSFAKFEAYKEWEKTATEEEKTAVSQRVTNQQTANDVVTLLEEMLNDKQGLKVSVGAGALGRVDFGIPFTGIGAENEKFRARAKKLLSQATLDKLLELKAAGGTLGAISEKELDILANAATELGALFDKEGRATGKFDMKEEDFKTALETMRMASMKVYIAESIGRDAYSKAGYQNMSVEDFDTVEKIYQDLKKNPPNAQNYAEEELKNPVNLDQAFNLIKQEEGLRTEAYQDQTGKWTIGFGTTTINGRPVKPGDRLTETQAQALMQQQVIQKYTTFADTIKTQVTPNQFAALTSFEYNLGSGVWQTPTGRQILALVNEGRNQEAGRLMLQYHKSRDPRTGELVTNRVLAQRRMREANLLLS